MIVFESISKYLFFLHFAAAACVAGSLIHLAVRVWGYMRGRVIKVSHEKLYAHILAASYTACYVLGALVYPTWRIRVRHDYFDTALRWATGLFEVKEHLATFGLVAVVGIWFLSRNLSRPADTQDRRMLPLYAGLVVVVLVVTAFNVWSGWYLTTLKGV